MGGVPDFFKKIFVKGVDEHSLIHYNGCIKRLQWRAEDSRSYSEGNCIVETAIADKKEEKLDEEIVPGFCRLHCC